MLQHRLARFAMMMMTADVLTELVLLLVQQLLVEENDSRAEKDPRAEIEQGQQLFSDTADRSHLHDVKGRVDARLGLSLGRRIDGGQHGASLGRGRGGRLARGSDLLLVGAHDVLRGGCGEVLERTGLLSEKLLEVEGTLPKEAASAESGGSQGDGDGDGLTSERRGRWIRN